MSSMVETLVGNQDQATIFHKILFWEDAQKACHGIWDPQGFMLRFACGPESDSRESGDEACLHVLPPPAPTLPCSLGPGWKSVV